MEARESMEVREAREMVIETDPTAWDGCLLQMQSLFCLLRASCGSFFPRGLGCFLYERCLKKMSIFSWLISFLNWLQKNSLGLGTCF